MSSYTIQFQLHSSCYWNDYISGIPTKKEAEKLMRRASKRSKSAWRVVKVYTNPENL